MVLLTIEAERKTAIRFYSLPDEKCWFSLRLTLTENRGALGRKEEILVRSFDVENRDFPNFPMKFLVPVALIN